MATIESEPRVVDVTSGGVINAVLEFLRTNMVCTLDTFIFPITAGLSIKSPPGGGLPTDIGKLLIEVRFTPDCHLWGVVWQPFPQMERIFPLPVEVTIAGVTYSMNISGPDYADYDFTSNVMSLIQNGTINADTESIEIVVKYPIKKSYNVLKPSIYTYEYDTVTATVPVDISLPVPPTPGCTEDTTITCLDGTVITTGICNTATGVITPTGNVCPTPTGPITCTPSMSSLTTPANIPFKMPDPADLTSPPTLDLSTFEIYASISVPCVPAGTPAKLFPMDLDLTIDDGISSITGLVTVAGAGIFTSNIVSMIKDLMLAKTRAELVSLSSVQLILKYPGKVEFADANAVGVSSETKSVEKWIPVSIPVPPTPGGCTEDTTFTCPDGTVITTGICNIATGVLTPTGNVCPTPGGCTEDTTFTCPDGTVITTGICNPATGVLTPTGNVCPTPGCTEDTTFTCPDGTVITTGICNTATGVITPTGNVCPVEPDHGEKRNPTTCWDGSMIHAEKYDTTLHRWIPSGEVCPTECTEDTKITCDDGSVVTTHLCIGGKSYPTGNVCPPTPGGCTKDTTFTCPDGTVITTEICNTATGVLTPTGNVCPPPIGCAEETVKDPFTCPDGSRIYLKKCVTGVWVDSGQKCPEAPPPGPAARKSVYTTTPLLTRVGKRVPIVGLVFCGTEKVGGEKAWISINGELLTTANTRNGTVTAEWTPVVPGLYTICVTVPESSACNAYGSACTMMQVVAELSKEEIKAAEEEFERAKERIGEIMERI
jgi:hypothetical protein